MSEKTRMLFYALWLVQPVLQTAIAVIMFRRGQHRTFKYFFAYIVALVATFAVIFPAYWYSTTAYFYLSWFATAISFTRLFWMYSSHFTRCVISVRFYSSGPAW